MTSRPAASSPPPGVLDELCRFSSRPKPSALDLPNLRWSTRCRRRCLQLPRCDHLFYSRPKRKVSNLPNPMTRRPTMQTAHNFFTHGNRPFRNACQPLAARVGIFFSLQSSSTPELARSFDKSKSKSSAKSARSPQQGKLFLSLSLSQPIFSSTRWIWTTSNRFEIAPCVCPLFGCISGKRISQDITVCKSRLFDSLFLSLSQSWIRLLKLDGDLVFGSWMIRNEFSPMVAVKISDISVNNLE